MKLIAAFRRDCSRAAVQKFSLNSCVTLVFLLIIFANAGAAKPTIQKPIERITLDWDHSGRPSVFTLSYHGMNDGLGDADYLTIKSHGEQRWVLANRDDEWGILGPTARFALDKPNIVSSKRLFFLRSGTTPKSRLYLILRGGGYGCCEGSLTILTPGDDGTPKVVFHAGTFLPRKIVPLKDGSGLEIVGQAELSEAWASKNAESYDPYRVYILKGSLRARYDENLSEESTIASYCQWAGPIYNEHFAAVGIPTGARHCHVMTREQFDRYSAKHPEIFAEPK